MKTSICIDVRKHTLAANYDRFLHQLSAFRFKENLSIPKEAQHIMKWKITQQQANLLTTHVHYHLLKGCWITNFIKKEMIYHLLQWTNESECSIIFFSSSGLLDPTSLSTCSPSFRKKKVGVARISQDELNSCNIRNSISQQCK